jgi:hypothetical protein
MEIVLKINGEVIDTILVTNQGPSGGAYHEGDYPGGDGERVYRWYVNKRYGHVLHMRRDGAHALAAAVLSATK